METEYREYSFGKCKAYTEQITVETTINTAERGGVTKVLSSEAEGRLAGVELMAGEAAVGGKVNYRLLYTDGTGKPCGLDYFKDFETKIAGEDIAPDDKWCAEMSVMAVGAKVNGDTVEVSAVLEVRLVVYGERSVKGVSAIAGAETLGGEIVCDMLVEKREYTVETTKEETVGALVKKVLLFDSVAAIRSCSLSDGYWTVEGEAHATVSYMTEEDDVAERSFSLPFTEVVEAKGDRTAFSCSVRNSRVVISGDESVSSIEAEVGVSIVACDYRMELTETLKDVYCPQYDVKLTREEVLSSAFVSNGFYRANITGVIEGAAEAERIVAVRPVGLAVANATAMKGAVKVEGVASFDVVYLKEGDYFTSQGELPFVSEFPFALAEGTEEARASVCVMSALAAPSASGANVSADVVFSVSLQKQMAGTVLTEAQEGAPREDDGAGISVYFADAGDDLWKIAKEMGVAPSVLLRANPILAEPLAEPGKILVFKSKYSEE